MVPWLHRKALSIVVSAVLLGSCVTPRWLVASEKIREVSKDRPALPPVDIFITYDKAKNKTTKLEENTSSEDAKEKNLLHRLPFLSLSELQALSVKQVETLVLNQKLKPQQIKHLSDQQLKSLKTSIIEILLEDFSLSQVKSLKGEQIAHLSSKSLRKILGSLDRYQIKFLLQDQIAQLSYKEIRRVFDHLEEDQLIHVAPQQLKAISKYKLAAKSQYLNREQFTTLSSSQLEGIIDTKRLSRQQAVWLTQEQIQGIEPYSFVELEEVLDNRQLRHATGAQLAALIRATSLSQSKIKAFSADAIAALEPVEFSMLYDSLSPIQLDNLYSDGLINEALIASLNKKQVQQTPVRLLSQLAPHSMEFVVEQLNKDQLQQLVAHNLSQLLALDFFSEDRIKKFDAEIIKELHPSNVSDLILHFTNEQITYLTSHQLMALDAEDMQQLSVSQILSFTPEQLALLSDKQVQGLRIDQVRALDESRLANVFAHLDDHQLSFLLDKQLYSVLGEIPEERYKQISPQSFKQLSPNYLLDLSEEKQQVLFKTFASSLTTDQFNLLLPQVVKGIADGELRGLSQELLAGLDSVSFEQILPKLAPEQLLNLTEEQVSNNLQLIENYFIGKDASYFLKILPVDTISDLSSDSLNLLQEVDSNDWSKEQVRALALTQIPSLEADFIEQQLEKMSYEQLLSISAFQLQSFSPAVLSKVSFDLLDHLSVQQLQAFSESQVKQFGDRLLESNVLANLEKFKVFSSSLGQKQINALSKEQLQGIFASLDPSQIELLDKEVYEGVDEAALSQLIEQQVVALPSEVLQTFSEGQLAAVFNRLSGDQLLALVDSLHEYKTTLLPLVQSEHIDLLGSHFLNELSSDELKILDRDVVARVSPEVLSALSYSTFCTIAESIPEQVKLSLHFSQIAEDIKEIHISELSKEVLPYIFSSLSAAHITEFSTEELSQLPEKTVASINPEVLSELPGDFFRKLSSTQIESLSYHQVAHIPNGALQYFTDFLIQLNENQVRSLSTKQIQSLPFAVLTELLPLLSPEQVSFVNPSDIARFNRQDIRRLSLAQISGLTQQQIQSFSSLQVASFSEEQVEAMSFFPSNHTFLRLYSHEYDLYQAQAEDPKSTNSAYAVFDARTQQKLDSSYTFPQEFVGKQQQLTPFKPRPQLESKEDSKQQDLLGLYQTLSRDSDAKQNLLTESLVSQYIQSTVFKHTAPSSAEEKILHGAKTTTFF